MDGHYADFPTGREGQRHLRFLLEFDPRGLHYTIGPFGTFSSVSLALPGSYDVGPASTVQYQTRERFLYECSASTIQQKAPHATTPNQYVTLASPITQASAPVHLEDANGFLIAYNADGTVFKYSVDQVSGELTFSTDVLPDGLFAFCSGDTAGASEEVGLRSLQKAPISHKQRVIIHLPRFNFSQEPIFSIHRANIINYIKRLLFRIRFFSWCNHLSNPDFTHTTKPFLKLGYICR